MMRHLPLFLSFLAIFCSMQAFSQGDLKELREDPNTKKLNADTTKGVQIKQINVPIPKLGLEVDYWKHWTKFGLNLNQATFSDNWKAGGVNSVAIGGTFWHKSEYNKDRFNFVSELDFRYGKVWNKDQLAKKNNDRIFWDNKLAYKFTDIWALYFSFTFESQFDVGYKYDAKGENIIDTLSSFMAPGYFTESFGLEYKPDKTFSLRFGTGTARQTLILDDRIAPPIEATKPIYGVEPGKKFKNDLAFQITANLDRNLSQNLNLKARYNLFADYKDVSDPDHRLDATLTAKVTSLVNVALTGILVYKSDESSRVQYSQALTMGIIYALPR
ncbi:DUF3078 domain-containing protein [Sphingobacterium yanglingense]|uniref:DUF3078 family protein n=1 Tax=Sphingobacterium yanglingense TaxID=1437280 RepID=A0A4R6WFM0_9SPHI|nr:DUF3078 domain-containing protein [Sphingobacterium yanglingense]TDQ76022.1 Protein of unknown function (DUF3078) [Sphingobacterium yanglingense]